MTVGEYSELKPLTDDVDGLTDDQESLDAGHRERREPRCRRKRRFVWIFMITLLVVLSNLFSAWLGTYIWRRFASLDSECAAYTTQYSPVLKEVDIKYTFKQFNGTFMQEEIYRRPGSPDVDAAWEALGVDYRAGLIPREEGFQSGLTQAHVQRADKYGGGFFVNVEGLHHLHCLNLVRKSLFYNYDYYKALGTHAFKNDEHILQLHVSHCLDILRQVLMCNVDTGVLGQVWWDKPSPQAFPDFNTRHKCKNYDDVRLWAEAHQAEPPETLPPDYMRYPAPDEILDTTP